MSLLLRCLLALSMILCTAAAAQPRPAAETIAIVGADVLPMVGPERLQTHVGAGEEAGFEDHEAW